MLRPLLSTVLLLFLAFGLAGMNILMIHAALAESADDDVSPETREEQTLKDSSPGHLRPRGKKLARFLTSPKNLSRAIIKERSSFTSLSPPHCDTGNFHGILKVFRI